MEESEEQVGLLRRILRAIGRPIGRFFDWLDRFLGRALLRAFAIPCLIGGSFAIYGGISNIAISREIPNWPTAPGVVTESRIGRGSKVRYVAIFKYDYEVNGIAHVGERVRRGESQGLEFLVKPRIERYPVGTEVTVRFNPDDPEDAVLEEGTDWMALFPLTIGAIFVFAGQWMWRTKKRISELEFG